MYVQYTTACAGPGVRTAIPPTTLIKAADNVRAYFMASPPARPIEKVLNWDDQLSDCVTGTTITRSYSTRCIGLVPMAPIHSRVPAVPFGDGRSAPAQLWNS